MDSFELLLDGPSSGLAHLIRLHKMGNFTK
jgi:hypothetical protein